MEEIASKGSFDLLEAFVFLEGDSMNTEGFKHILVIAKTLVIKHLERRH